MGGFIGTILVAVSIALLSFGYRRQKYIEELRSFEARFFEMLKYQRENMAEIEIDGIKGRRAFVSFIREWRIALKVVERAAEVCQVEVIGAERGRLAYLAFFHGSGQTSRINLTEAAKKLGYDEALVAELIKQMSDVWSQGSVDLCSPASKKFARISSGDAKDLAYVPFEGHYSRLAHYFRHLYQLVHYAHMIAPESSEDDHIGLVTAQLSTHEQALLALHAYSIESRWTGSSYINKYQLIGDLPDTFIRHDEFPMWEVYDRNRKM